MITPVREFYGHKYVQLDYHNDVISGMIKDRQENYISKEEVKRLYRKRSLGTIPDEEDVRAIEDSNKLETEIRTLITTAENTVFSMTHSPDPVSAIYYLLRALLMTKGY